MVNVEEKWLSKLLDTEYFESVSNPRFLELDGLVILEYHYIPESFEQWKETIGNHSSPGALQKIENTINHIHLDEIVKGEKSQIAAGEYLQKIWLDVLSVQFPNYEFVCKVEPFKMGWELVMWKQR
jgi:hypothetical protein